MTRRDMMGAAVAGPTAAIEVDRWRSVRALYDLPAGVVQLENGNWGAMARPVRLAYEAHTERVNRDTSYYARRGFDADAERVRRRVAEALAATPEELVFTRNATEALQALIGGYNRLQPGDGVMIADTDYDAMQTAMRWLRTRRGARLVEVALPENATRTDYIDAYDRALAAAPHVRLLLLTHVSHRHGLRLPVQDIAANARARNVDVIVDAAHAWGQLDITISDIGADFVGLNAHKWIGAPLGVGLLYIRRSRIEAIDPFMGESGYPAGDIRARVHTGTMNFAAVLAVADALDQRASIGAAAIEARLAHLRRRWTERLRGRVDVLTATDETLCSAIGAFRLQGQTSREANTALARRLLDQYGVFTVVRHGLVGGSCVRVTPALFTSEEEIDRFCSAVEAISA